MKNFDLKKYLIENKLTKTSQLNEGFQGDEPNGDGLSGFRGNNNSLPPESEEDRIQRKNKEDILKLKLDGGAAWKRGVGINNGPYKDQDSFEYMYWKQGWEAAELADEKRKQKKQVK